VNKNVTIANVCICIYVYSDTGKSTLWTKTDTYFQGSDPNDTTSYVQKFSPRLQTNSSTTIHRKTL